MATGKTVGRPKVVPIGSDDAYIDYGNTGVLIPEGDYQAVCLGHETAFTFGTPKLYLQFKIIDPEEHFGLTLFKAYRVKSLVGKPSRNGRVRLAANGELALMLYRVLRLQRRLDRLPLSELRDRAFMVRVRTVKKDYRQRPRPEPLWYSIEFFGAMVFVTVFLMLGWLFIQMFRGYLPAHQVNLTSGRFSTPSDGSEQASFDPVKAIEAELVGFPYCA